MLPIDYEKETIVGTKCPPEVFEMLVRKGSTISVIIDGIPDYFELRAWGFDYNEQLFWMTFLNTKVPKPPEGTPVQWVTPTYRRMRRGEVVI